MALDAIEHVRHEDELVALEIRAAQRARETVAVPMVGVVGEIFRVARDLLRAFAAFIGEFLIVTLDASGESFMLQIELLGERRVTDVTGEMIHVKLVVAGANIFCGENQFVAFAASRTDILGVMTNAKQFLIVRCIDKIHERFLTSDAFEAFRMPEQFRAGIVIIGDA